MGVVNVVDLTKEFIAIPSPNLPGDERAMAAAVQGVGQSLGIGQGIIVGAREEVATWL